MSTPSPTTGESAAAAPIPASTATGGYAPAAKGEKPTMPPITGGQRANAILAGLAGHILFAIGWFGIAFVALGPLVSGLVNDLLGNLLGGDSYAQDFTSILQRGGALLWFFILVFLVGSIVFVVFGIISAFLILRRGGVDKPGRVNSTSFVIAAIIDIPVFLFVLWIATLVTDNSVGLLWLPPLLGLVLAAAIGLAVWWLMAIANRGPAKPKPVKPGKPGKAQKEQPAA